MNKEILTLVDVLASEKNVSLNIVFDALEEALVSATKRLHKEDILARVDINKNTGEYKTYRRWLVVPSEQGLQAPDQEILLFEAQEQAADIQIDDYIEEEIESVPLGRIAAQAAKQVILQRIREAEREQILSEFLEESDGLFIGIVRRADRRGFILESGRVEAYLPREDAIAKENFRVGDRVKAYIQTVDNEAKGPPIQLSRTSADFLVKLFENEVPEVENGHIEIMAAARDPGVRAKVAVRTSEQRLDPIGAMVGVRGTRINAVRNQLCNEAIDIIIWSEDIAQYVINALAPAQIKSIVLDEERRLMQVIVQPHELAIAIGRNGQNVRLASDLTGWEIDVLSTEESEQRQQEQAIIAQRMFMHDLQMELETAEMLTKAGIFELEELAYMPIEELQKVDIANEQLESYREKAREVLLMIELSEEEKIEDETLELRTLFGMTEDILNTLNTNNIHTRDDLAELASDELIEIIQIDEEAAKKMILDARAHWFN